MGPTSPGIMSPAVPGQLHKSPTTSDLSPTCSVSPATRAVPVTRWPAHIQRSPGLLSLPSVYAVSAPRDCSSPLPSRPPYLPLPRPLPRRLLPTAASWRPAGDGVSSQGRRDRDSSVENKECEDMRLCEDWNYGIWKPLFH